MAKGFSIEVDIKNTGIYKDLINILKNVVENTTDEWVKDYIHDEMIKITNKLNKAPTK